VLTVENGQLIEAEEGRSVRSYNKYTIKSVK